MEDKKIICKDCGKEFIFTVGEQEFYKEKGFENDPVRCPDCRRARKAQKKEDNSFELMKELSCSSFFYNRIFIFIFIILN